ncbi:hypothetical protein [Nocardiopsis chromatogenes]|uniref:hypothetical protein n=1 Tax=Nocardiopsis chromatogenes TaxID=280239 RepID=UPI00034896A6|nr:hypothetical protein [Nocardiopsis chromatogenes]
MASEYRAGPAQGRTEGADGASGASDGGAVTLTLPRGFASWLTGTDAIRTPGGDPFHASARRAVAGARARPTGDVDVTCDIGGICVIGEQAYKLAHTPGIPEALLDEALVTLERFHSAMDAWTAKEGMCVDCGGSGRGPDGEPCPQCKGTGRIPTGW